MKFRIHWTVNGQEDSLDIEGKTIEDIRMDVEEQMDMRGLNLYINNIWSEEIKS